ncbi:T9SS type A sorting domain-containing protein [Rubrivirga sp. IMCC45206]|uniref:T9SS type A sorting domain-containing protein n=1 Tax=Rubrivirga sp. IMCC45206 TaxID=3391614 RepID=UPI00398FDE80
MNTRYSLPDSPSSDRLAAYSAAAAGALLAFAPVAADAQISHTEVDEPLTTGSTRDFDFDGDGNVDAQLVLDSPGAGFTRALIFTDESNGAGVVGMGPVTTNYNYFYATPLDMGEAISGSNTIQNTNVGSAGNRDDFLLTSSFNGTPYGSWQGGVTDKYIGVRFTANAGTPSASTHFAWIKMDVASSTQARLKGFAFEQTPDFPINAGDEGAAPPPPPPPPTATEPDALAEGYAFTPVAPNPITGRSTFEVTVARTEQVTVDVVDALGRTVRTLHDGAIAGGQDKEIAFVSDGLPTGIYVVRVVGESFDTTRTVTVVR